MTNNNLILKTDSYKISHWLQLPKGLTNIYGYIESRGGKFDELVFFGLQPLLKQLERPVKMEDVEEADRIFALHLGPNVFNYDGWKYIVEEHAGYLPIRIKAMKEGSVVPTKVPLATVECTDPNCAWLFGVLETVLLRAVWYGTTVATNSFHTKKLLIDFMKRTADEQYRPDVDFMMHDFGARGVSSGESAGIGGLAHLLSFAGTDTIEALKYAIDYYDEPAVAGNSIIASEHMTMCVNADSENRYDYNSAEKMVSILEDRVKATGEFQIVAMVADTYDVFRFAREFVGEKLKERILNSGGRIVIRPDSGDPIETPVKVVEILLDQFKNDGVTYQNGRYRLLPPCIRVIQGDGIDYVAIRKICELAESKGISVANFAFGQGGGLLQKVSRDDQKFAMKASHIVVDGKGKDIFKDPITDPGKTSKRGRVTTFERPNGEMYAATTAESVDDKECLVTVYENGRVTYSQAFASIKSKVGEHF